MKFTRSQQIVEEASAFVPAGVHSDFRLGWAPHPLVFDRADGAHLIDVDGNTFADYVLGMGPMLLGHRPRAVVEAVTSQLNRAILVGGQTEVEFAAAQLVVDLVPSAEQVRFGSSGSEVVHAALRLARAATGRRRIVKFEGHYHGWFDNVMWSVAPDLVRAGERVPSTPVAGSAGMPDAAADDLIVLPWNDPDAVRRALLAGDVAAVIMEPMMINTSGVLPRPGYLESVREACTRAGTILIFDEVITGFRIAPGGAQERFGVLPDLTTMGKALANGFPVAALAGSRQMMSLLADRSVVHGGTYNAQGPSMAAVVATLECIKDGGAVDRVERAGLRLQEGLRRAFQDAALPARITGFPGAFHVAFEDGQPWDYRSALGADRTRYVEMTTALLSHHVRVLPRGTWFVSSEHSDDVVDEAISAVQSLVGRGRSDMR